MKNCNCCTTYNAPDLMDGGVMAAVTEQEADDAAHWLARAERLEKRVEKAEENVRAREEMINRLAARAEKAEQERDVLAKRVRDFADSIREQQKMIDRLRAEHPRSLTPDDYQRAWLMFLYHEARGDDRDVAVRAAVDAALTEPTRPEGAEKIEKVLREEWTFSDEDGGEEAFADLAGRLAQRGVRVVSEEDE